MLLRAPTPAAPRASDSDREAAIDALREAAADGRLDFEELAERVEDAGRARTLPELAALTRDLGPRRGLAPAAVARHRTVLSKSRRGGRWAPGARSRYLCVLGTVDLDLRHAELDCAVVDVEVVPVLGTVRLQVPTGVAVEVESGGLLTSCRVRHDGPPAPPGAPVVRVRVRGVCGSVDVRVRPTLSEQLRYGLRRLLGTGPGWPGP